MRLIDADALLEYLGIETTECTKCKNGFSIYGYCKRGGDFQDACYAIDSAPTVDAIEVVRCRDCKHNPLETWFDCPLAHLKYDGERWCWKGERKDGDSHD